jgi:tetratricopeptide (TPR) repeat protein
MLRTLTPQRVALLLAILALSASATTALAQIPGQFAQDFVAGRVPSQEEIAKLEQEVAAHPDDLRLIRKLGKGYFFQVFGEGRASSIAKSQKMLERALEIRKDDAETTAYLGSLRALTGQRSKDASERAAAFNQAFELLKKAQALAPDHPAVLAVTGASYLFLPDSFNAAPLALENMEKLRQMMGPMYNRQSHHGQQRILLTQGQAYARMGQPEKARACFEEALKVDQESDEAALLKAEIGKLKPTAQKMNQ